MASSMAKALKSELSQTSKSERHPTIWNAQDNYRTLKEKYTQLCNDYEQLQKAYIVLEKKNDTEERYYLGEIQKIRKAKEGAVAEFHSYTIESEQRIQHFKEQLEKQYRNVENKELEEQQGKLQRQIIETNAELRKTKRESEQREMEIRNAYEEQINNFTNKFLDAHRKSVEEGNDKSELDILRQRYRMLDEQYHRLHEESERRQFESDNKIQRLESDLLERTMRFTRSAIALEQLSMEVEKYRRNMEFDDAELQRLQSEVKRLQKEKLEVERESMVRESSLTGQLLNQSLLIDKKLNEIEKNVAQKDELVEVNAPDEIKKLEELIRHRDIEIRRIMCVFSHSHPNRIVQSIWDQNEGERQDSQPGIK
ncbi:hypothetical protein Tcan_08960 [Toxocara canis]|uniref:Uncharacterized protein n=1 Tax=Toxocara canis TaxID=6265 RepID=A0A0B2VT23_TOXCA|nr:hypothetical protein Tcan_08960 [Toxocara canis]